MARASLPGLRAALLLIVGLASLDCASAGDRDGARPVTNTFLLVTAAAPKPADGPRAPSNGVGVPPARPVVSNPYHVPLLQNAGTLGVR